MESLNDVQTEEQSVRHMIPIKVVSPIPRNSNPLKSKSLKNALQINEVEQVLSPISETPRPVAKQCRICLQDERDGRMVVPCKCTGSISYTHEHCLIEWIKRKIENNFKTRAKCEMCDTQFNYRMSHSRQFDCEQMAKNYGREKQSFRCFISIMGLSLIGFFALIIIVLLGSSNGAVGDKLRSTIMPSAAAKAIYISVIFVYLIIFSVIVLLFLSQYAVKTSIIIKEVLNYNEPRLMRYNYKIYMKKEVRS